MSTNCALVETLLALPCRYPNVHWIRVQAECLKLGKFAAVAFAVHWLCMQCCELIANKLETLYLYVPEACPAALLTKHSMLFTAGAEQHPLNLYAALHD